MIAAVLCATDYASAFRALCVLDQLDRTDRGRPRRYVRKATKGKVRRTLDWSHWSLNGTENCLLAPKKRRRKPFVLVCPNIGIVRRRSRPGVHWFMNRVHLAKRDHRQRRRANPATPTTPPRPFPPRSLTDDPCGIRSIPARSFSKWNYRVIREPLTSTGFKNGYLDTRLLYARFVLKQGGKNPRRNFSSYLLYFS